MPSNEKLFAIVFAKLLKNIKLGSVASRVAIQTTILLKNIQSQSGSNFTIILYTQNTLKG